MTTFLHVIVTLRGEKERPRLLFADLDEAGLKRKFIKPYRRGERIVIGNDLISLSETAAVRIIEKVSRKKLPWPGFRNTAMRRSTGSMPKPGTRALF